MAPEGPILLELTNHSSRSLRARWTAPPKPNGNLSYTLYYKSRGISCECEHRYWDLDIELKCVVELLKKITILVFLNPNFVSLISLPLNSSVVFHIGAY